MNFLRSSVLMFAALAAGVGGRFGFHRVAHDPDLPLSNSRHGKAGDSGVSRSVSTFSANPGPRPEASAILSAFGATRLRLLMAWLPGASDEELLQMAGSLVNTVTDENLSIRLLMARWAEVNPRALLSWSQSQRDANRFGRDFYVNNAVEAWARVDFEAAWAAAGSGLRRCRGSALLGLTAVDPEKCRRLLAAEPSLMDLNGFENMSKVVARIAIRNPAGAAALLEGAPVARQSRLARGIAEAWVRSDPAGAVDWMKTLPVDVRAATLLTAGEWIAAHAPDKISDFLEGLPPGRLRSAVMAADLQRLAASDPVSARRRVDEMPAGPARQYGRALLMQELLKDGDPKGALELAGQTGWRVDRVLLHNESDPFQPNAGPRETPEDAMRELFAQLAGSDPKASAAVLALKGRLWGLAQAAAGSNPAGVAAALSLKQGDGVATSACSSVIGEWAARDPRAAAAWVEALPVEGTYRTTLQTPLLQSWAKTDPAAMLEWAAQREGGATKAAWDQIGWVAPEYATAHLKDLFAANVPESVQGLLSALQQRPECARNVIRQMPDNMNVPLGSVMNQWLKDNPQEASTWVAGLPGGLKREHATESMVAWLNNNEHDYEAAFQWAATLSPEKRDSLMRLALGSLRKEDPQRAEAVIRASPLPPEEQQRYLRKYGLTP